MSDDYYNSLGLDRTATSDEIRKEVNKRIRAVQSDQYSSNKDIVARAESTIKELKKMRTLLLDNVNRKGSDEQQVDNASASASQSLMPELSIDDFIKEKSSSRRTIIDQGFSIALLMDTSWSMSGKCLDDAKTAMHCFLDELPGSSYLVALVSFGCRTGVICSLTEDMDEIRDGIDSLTATNRTPLLSALNSVGDEVFPDSLTESLIVIATDGHPDESEQEILSYASVLKKRGIRIIVIGIGTGLPVEFLKLLASSENDYFFAKASVELKKIYEKISSGLAESS